MGVGQELVQTCCGCVTVDITAKADAPAQSSGRHTSGSPPEAGCQQGPADVMWGFGPLQSKGLSIVFSNTTVQKHQFFCAYPSL